MFPNGDPNVIFAGANVQVPRTEDGTNWSLQQGFTEARYVFQKAALRMQRSFRKVGNLTAWAAPRVTATEGFYSDIATLEETQQTTKSGLLETFQTDMSSEAKTYDEDSFNIGKTLAELGVSQRHTLATNDVTTQQGLATAALSGATTLTNALAAKETAFTQATNTEYQNQIGSWSGEPLT